MPPCGPLRGSSRPGQSWRRATWASGSATWAAGRADLAREALETGLALDPRAAWAAFALRELD